MQRHHVLQGDAEHHHGSGQDQLGDQRSNILSTPRPDPHHNDDNMFDGTPFHHPQQYCTETRPSRLHLHTHEGTHRHARPVTTGHHRERQLPRDADEEPVRSSIHGSRSKHLRRDENNPGYTHQELHEMDQSHEIEMEEDNTTRSETPRT